MQWLAMLPPSKAFSLAALWPLALVGLPLLVIRGMVWWRMPGDLMHIELVATGASLVALWTILLGPPLAFLIAWGIARR